MWRAGLQPANAMIDVVMPKLKKKNDDLKAMKGSVAEVNKIKKQLKESEARVEEL